uniref:SANT domain-containing protein n=1 Tax=Timspurckia oligopyrenoides TaxID=708627 RepID=A0A7S0ZDG9_9RHOD
MFVDGLRQYDRNFNAICSHIGSRSADQVKGRYRRTLKKLKGRNVVLNGSDEELEAVCNYELKEARKRAGPMKLGSVRLKCDPIAASEGRYKVQIIPCDDIDSQLLVEHGFNPKILIILRGSRSIRGVVNHLNTRWQSALESSGKSVELVTSTLDNKVVEVSGTVEALFIAIGCPSTFRLMYKLEPLEKSSNAIQMKSNHYAQCSDTLKQTSDQNHIPFEHHSTSAPSATKAVLPSDAAVSLPGDSVFGLFGQNTMNQAHGTGATVDTISEPVAASQYIPLTWNENAVDTEFSNDHNTPSISPPSLCPEENSLLVGTGFSTLFGQMPASNQ